MRAEVVVGNVNREPVVQPFLKWPGGKRWLVPRLAPLLRRHAHSRYFEPFLGSGAMHLGVQFPNAILGDVNEELIAALAVIAEDPERVVSAVWRFTNTAECYYRVRRSRPRTPVGTAARFLYLNRTAWGGVYRLNGRGEFNTPFGDSGRVICRLQSVVQAAGAFARADLRAVDFEDLMDESGAGDVVYADPPYVSPTSGHDNFKRYSREAFCWSDQERLAVAAAGAVRRGAHVAVSGRAGFGLERLYPDWLVLHLRRSCRVSRAPEGRGKFSEIVLFSPNFKDVSVGQAEQSALVERRVVEPGVSGEECCAIA
jgi:DNA adenine methylase